MLFNSDGEFLEYFFLTFVFCEVWFLRKNNFRCFKNIIIKIRMIK